jgi:hypothetical protein
MDKNTLMLKSKNRLVRCQGVILKDDSILILEHFNSIRNEKFWLLPGGGMELGESEEECIRSDEDSWSIIQNKEQFYPSLKQIKDKIINLVSYVLAHHSSD